MYPVLNITDDTLQNMQLVLPDLTSIDLTICFKPLQYGWFIQSLIYKDVEIDGRRIFVSPNLLYQFKNQIPFGLACIASQGREPTLQQDFLSGAVTLYVLSADEVAEFGSFISG